jgi:hypothetical protein
VKRVVPTAELLYRCWSIRLDEYADGIAEAIIETFSIGTDARSNI